MAQRRKRRTKAEIEAEKQAKAAQAAEDAKMEAEGYEKKRLRDEHGHFIKDDPSTPENEAWEWVKKEEEEKVEEVITEVVEEPTVSKLEPEPEPAPKQAKPKVASTDPHYGIKQARFGGGRLKWKRRTRGEQEF